MERAISKIAFLKSNHESVNYLEVINHLRNDSVLHESRIQSVLNVYMEFDKNTDYCYDIILI